jgi:hypothetical protein
VHLYCIIIAVSTILAGSFQAQAKDQIKTLCSLDENVYFSCTLRGKIVSLYASPDLSKRSGHLKYRFVTPGKSPELTYPENSAKPAESFSLFHSSYAKGSSTQVTFHRSGLTYTLYHESNVFDVMAPELQLTNPGSACASAVRQQINCCWRNLYA